MSPRKANTPTLTRERIISAAVELVDRDGLEALSMRKLAAELSVGTMTLYYHVEDKSALYDLLLDHVMSEVDVSADDATAPAEERVRGIAYALREAMLAHPHIAVLALSRSLRTPAQLRPVERLLQILRRAGLSPSQAMHAVNVIGQYTLGVTSMYAYHLNATDYRDEREGEYGGLTPDEFPALFDAMQQAEGPADWEADFESGLSAIISGLVTDVAEGEARYIATD
jgi:AcrR family transcriptional regulator